MGELLDVNAYDPAGVNQNAMRFLEAFLIYCLLDDSPPLDDDALVEVAANHGRTAKDGRNPDFCLRRRGREIPLKAWAGEILDDVGAIASIIDRGEGGDAYTLAVQAQATLVENPDATPSARILEDMRQKKAGFFDFAMECARSHRDYFSSLAELEADRERIYADEAAASLERQRQIEADDAMNFDDYLERYYSEQGCCD